MIKRLRLKFVCINMALVTAMLLVIFGMVLHSTQEDLEKQSMGMIQRVMNDRGMDDRGMPSRPGGPEVHLPWFQVTWDLRGEQAVLYNGFEDRFDEAALQKIIALARESGERSGILKAYRLRFHEVPSPFGEQLVFVDISSEMATMQNLVKTSAFIGVLSFVLFLGISIALSRWAVRPVEEAWNQQRQFVADASHELKTPLTVIMTNAELLREPGYAAEDRERFSESILTMSRQMRGLVEGLLNLARVDNGAVQLHFSAVDFSELISDSVLPFEPLYFERQLELDTDVEDGIRVRGSRDHLKQVADILLDNAAKYTTPDTVVRVVLRRQGSHCLLSVAGAGLQISREDLKNIFKRFYRIDKARTGDGSYGLGLSIAGSIVAEHGGRIWAESEAGLNTFFVQLSEL